MEYPMNTTKYRTTPSILASFATLIAIGLVACSSDVPGQGEDGTGPDEESGSSASAVTDKGFYPCTAELLAAQVKCAQNFLCFAQKVSAGENPLECLADDSTPECYDGLKELVSCHFEHSNSCKGASSKGQVCAAANAAKQRGWKFPKRPR
jgi:hypothetical protein